MQNTLKLVVEEYEEEEEVEEGTGMQRSIYALVVQRGLVKRAASWNDILVSQIY